MHNLTQLWHIPPTTRLRWRRWGAEYIAYNVASGETHYMNSFAKTILQYFEAEAGTISGLIEDIKVSGAMTGPSSTAFCDQICELVKEFDSLGLIARVSK